MGKRISLGVAALCMISIAIVAYQFLTVADNSNEKSSAAIVSPPPDPGVNSPTVANSKPEAIPKPKPLTQGKPQKTATMDQQDQEPADFIDQARQALDNADVSIRIQVVRQLRNEVSEEAIALLESSLDDPSTEVVKSALNSIAFIGKNEPFGEKVYEILENKALDRDFPERGQALVIAALFSGDDRILPVIEDFISGDGDSDAMGSDEAGIRSAAQALSAIASPACIQPLQQILDSTTDPAVQRMAIYTLAKINDPQALDTLQAYLRDSSDLASQVNSARALAAFDKSEYNEILVDNIRYGEVNDQVLAAIGSSPAGPDVLGQLILDEQIEKQERIEYLDILRNGMLSSTNETRAGIMETVTPLLNCGDSALEMKAIEILGMGFGDMETAEILKPKLTSSDNQIREMAVDAYRSYITEENYKPMLDLIWDEDETVRQKAFMIVAKYIDQSDYPLLEKAKDHKDKVIREQAAAILNASNRKF